MIEVEELETDIVDHCNLKCVHCSHHSPYLRQKVMGLEQFSRDIETAAKVLHSNYYYLLGGEPLLHPQLEQFVDIVRSSGISKNIGIMTNGHLWPRLSDSLLSKIDRLHINFYPQSSPRFQQLHQELLNFVATKSIQHPKLKIKFSEKNHFRKSEILSKHLDATLVSGIYRDCQNRRSHAIYRGHLLKCSVSCHKGAFLCAHNIQEGSDLSNLDLDGICLHHYGPKELEATIQNYLQNNTPMRACYWCLGTSGELFSIKQE